MGGAWIMSQHIPDDKSRLDLRNIHELRGKRLVAQVTQTRRLALYSRTGVVLMLQLESSWHGRSVDHVSTYSGRQITIRSEKASRITRQKTCCTSESNTSVRVVFAKRSGFDTLIGVVWTWEECGSCLNIFRTKHCGRISKTFTNYEAKDSLRKSVNHVSTYSGRQIAVGSRKPSRITRQNTRCARAWIMSQHSPDDKSWLDLGNLHELRGKRLVAQVSQTRWFALYLRTGVVLMLRLESSWHGRSVDHVSTYSGRQIAVGSQKPSRITMPKTCCAREWLLSQHIPDDKSRSDLRNLHELRGKRLVAQVSQTRQVRVVFANRSGFDAPIGVVLAWQERGSCLNIFRTTNRGRISETFTNYVAKDLLRKAWIMSQHIPDDKSRSNHRNLHEKRGKRPIAHVSQTRQFALDSRTGVVLIVQLESSWHGRSVDHVSTYSGRQIALSWHGRSADHVSTCSGQQIPVGSWKPSRFTRQNTRCASESNTSVRVVFANRSGFDAPVGVVLAWEERGSCLNIFRTTNCGRISKTFTNYKAKDLLRKGVKHVGSRTRVVLMLQLESSWHGRSVDHVSTYSGRKIPAESQKPSRITRQKTYCARESNSRFALYSRTGVVLMVQLESPWHGRSVDHFSTYSGRQIAVGSEKPSRIMRQKTCCASESNTSVRVVFANWSRFDAPIGVVLAREERGSCLKIFRMTNRGQISETFTNYEVKDLLRKSVDHVSTYSGREIEVGSQKPSRITRQKTCCARAWIMSQHIPDDKSRSDLGNLHELRGKRLVAEVSETRRFALYLRTGAVLMLRLESSWHGRSVDHVSTYSGRQIKVGSQKPSRITRQKTCCARESNTSVRVVFANRSGFDAPIGVVLSWEDRGSCLNIVRMTNRGRISETFTNYEAKDLLRKHGRSVDHVSTCLGRQIAIGSQNKPSRITRQKTCCASESNTSVRVVLANRSGFDAPIGIVLAWEECGSCVNIFRTTNPGRISETFTNYEAKDLLRKRVKHVGSRTRVVLVLQLKSSWHGRSVDHVSTCSGQQIPVGSWKPSRFTRQKTCCGRVWIMSQHIPDSKSSSDLGNLHELRGKRLVAQVSQTRRLAMYSRTGVVLMLQLESSWHGRCVDHVSTYFGRQIAVGSRKHSRITRQKTYCARESNSRFALYLRTRVKPSRIPRQKTCCASESNTSVRVVLANRSDFDAPIGVVLVWEEHGSCLNIFRMTNRGQISETFTNYEVKDLLRKSVDHVSTYSGRQIAVGSHKPSQITRQKTCCASESNTLVPVVFANRSDFDAPIGVVLAWMERGSCLNIFRMINRGEERGSCLNVFRTTNRGRILEPFTNYEAKDLLRNRHGMGIAWIMSQHIPDDKSRSDFRNLHQLRGKRLVAQVSQTRRFALYSRTGVVFMLQLESSWHGRSVDHVSTYSGRQIAVGSRKPSRITRQKTCCARAWIMSQHIPNDKSRSDLRNLHELRGKRLVAQVSETRRFANRSGFDAPIGVVLAWEERGSCLNIFRTKNRDQILETLTNYEAKDLLRKLLKQVRSRTGVVLMLRLESSWHGRSVDHVSTYSGRQITVGSQKPSRITRQKTYCANESNTAHCIREPEWF
ncbi:uncharacterized protein G2W53_033660 [Senna tora]|uniref:Uncharacterized protein n=1 Tax=Senna tora TaxID=362788 RepID=A0A834T9V5_9FABA|nr:uncharacterized protein G2W53_033660 [Senna tora]